MRIHLEYLKSFSPFCEGALKADSVNFIQDCSSCFNLSNLLQEFHQTSYLEGCIIVCPNSNGLSCDEKHLHKLSRDGIWSREEGVQVVLHLQQETQDCLCQLYSLGRLEKLLGCTQLNVLLQLRRHYYSKVVLKSVDPYL